MFHRATSADPEYNKIAFNFLIIVLEKKDNL